MKHLPVLKPGSIDYQFTEDVNRRQRIDRIARGAWSLRWLILLATMAVASTFVAGYQVGLTSR